MNIYKTTIHLKEPEAIKNFLRALQKSERFIRGNPDESLRLMADCSKIESEVLSEIWAAYSFSLTLDQPLLMSLEDQALWAIKKRLMDNMKIPNYLNLIYIDGLKAVKLKAVTVIH